MYAKSMTAPTDFKSMEGFVYWWGFDNLNTHMIFMFYISIPLNGVPILVVCIVLRCSVIINVDFCECVKKMKS